MPARRCRLNFIYRYALLGRRLILPQCRAARGLSDAHSKRVATCAASPPAIRRLAHVVLRHAESAISRGHDFHFFPCRSSQVASARGFERRRDFACLRAAIKARSPESSPRSGAATSAASLYSARPPARCRWRHSACGHKFITRRWLTAPRAAAVITSAD